MSGTDRARARELAVGARDQLHELARVVQGDLATIRETTAGAIHQTTDILDALQFAVEADLREWADAHGEKADVLNAEAMGEL